MFSFAENIAQTPMAKIKRHAIEAEDRRINAMTLGDLAREGLHVFCWCNRCSHSGVLETDPLLAELGPDFPVPDLGIKLRCSGCQSKDIATRPDWPGLGQVTNHN